MREIRASANALVANAGASDEIVGCADAGKVTWYNILVHNSGLGWIQLQNACKTPDEVVDKICSMPFAYETGSTVLYTDLGLILMGIAMERRCGKPLDVLLDELVCQPLGLTNTGYNRVAQGAKTENTAPTEFCAWRDMRVHGLVHDENSYFMDGVAGHAGVFSCAREVAKLGEGYLAALKGREGAFLPKETVEKYIQFQQMNRWDRRGIMFQLRIIQSDAHTFPLGRNTFGHTGFTGTCMWVDPDRDMVFALLTNDVYAGRACRTLGSVRKSIVEEIVCAIDLEEMGR
jgi:CubicO group peptidase (beta-lactamase class C family)